jgi:hypothetical protein
MTQDAKQTMKDLQNTRRKIGRVNAQEYAALTKQQPKKNRKRVAKRVAKITPPK